MKIGILALQGDYLLHKNVLDRLDVESLYIRTANELSKCDSLIIPGGESTTMSILIQTFELYDSIRDFSLDHTVFGTCAGAILMSKSSKDRIDIKEALQILDEDHFGLDKVKERIIEYLAVRNLKQNRNPDGNVRGPILCFGGPPGRTAAAGLSAGRRPGDPPGGPGGPVRAGGER